MLRLRPSKAGDVKSAYISYAYTHNISDIAYLVVGLAGSTTPSSFVLPRLVAGWAPATPPDAAVRSSSGSSEGSRSLSWRYLESQGYFKAAVG